MSEKRNLTEEERTLLALLSSGNTTGRTVLILAGLGARATLAEVAPSGPPSLGKVASMGKIGMGGMVDSREAEATATQTHPIDVPDDRWNELTRGWSEMVPGHKQNPPV